MTLLSRSAVLLGSAAALFASPAAKVENTSDATQAEAIKKLESVGASVRPIAQNDPRLEISFLGYGSQVGLDQKNQPARRIDQDLAPVAGLSNTVYLRLGRTDVTDQGLAHLAGLKELTKLNLEQTKISDAGLAQLKNLSRLEYLNLYGTEVTDAGLKHLEPLKGLKNLYLWQTKVTAAGVEKLKKALPETQINWQRN